ncbi:MAG: hypothetical protein PHI12_06850 [Dehalococcoidales bacterium]|nr:hypothetical protein [Dehalococcoidales bacterium]
MNKYTIKQVIITKPEIELPEGSQVVSVQHHSAYTMNDAPFDSPECWQVIWLEPINKTLQ